MSSWFGVDLVAVLARDGPCGRERLRVADEDDCQRPDQKRAVSLQPIAGQADREESGWYVARDRDAVIGEVEDLDGDDRRRHDDQGPRPACGIA